MHWIIVEPIENKLILTGISLIIGAILKTLIDKILNKTKIIYYHVNTEKIALSNNDPIFGNIKVEWNNLSVNNLYNTVIEIENTTSVDFENLELKVWSNQDTLLLNEKTHMISTTRIIEWSEAYKKEIYVSDGEQATESQINIYRHERKYSIPVFNRGQKLQFIYLSTLISDENTNFIQIEMIYPGLQLKQRYLTNKIHNVLVQDALFWGLFASIIAMLLSPLYIENIWIVAVLCTLTGLFAQSIGAYIFKFIIFIRDLLTK